MSRSGSVVTVGGLLPRDLLDRVAAGDQSLVGMEPTAYGLVPGERLIDAITRSWNRLHGVWTAFARAAGQLSEADQTATGLTRDRWLRPLFDELGFAGLPLARGLEIDGKSYPISHEWAGTVPVHLTGTRVPLDRISHGVKGAAQTSPHGLVQAVLNRSEAYQWGMVANGLLLRVLRDNAAMTRQAYVEFDLEAMFEGEAFSDFVLLWLCCHRTRFEGGPAERCILEQWSAEAVSAGTRALDKLRAGVEAAIAALGEGFLAHPANLTLRSSLRSGELATLDYQHQLLRVVYRLLFLLVAEDRDLLLTPTASAEARRRYAFYSVDRIRRLAAKRRGTAHADLWAGLEVTVKALASGGAPVLGIAPLGSSLWAPAATAALNGAALGNRHLLEAVRQLCYVRDSEAKALRAVDYRNLGSEELGSIYESLLELHAVVDVDARRFELATAAGNERKTSGSHYTPTSLIAVLLDSALEPVLDDAARQSDPEAAVLKVSVLDPACGSGHFLIAAAHRIAQRLATVRGGGVEPSPPQVRTALRDVIGRCIHGIDVNPMAVELCKVSLWLEAMDPGRPLSFLDHRIICGNALLGATPRMLAEGVPAEAFKAIEGDDTKVAPLINQRNKKERVGQGALSLFTSSVADLARPVASAIAAIDALPDDSAEAVAVKEALFEDLNQSDEGRRARLAADAWCAAFFSPKVQGNEQITTGTVRQLADDPGRVSPALVRHVETLAAHYRFLHPHLAFPDIFSTDGASGDGWNQEAGWSGGFSVVLGNPPWETISPDAKEFFAQYAAEIRFVKKADQDRIIAEILEQPAIAASWQQYRRDLFTTANFLKSSGRYRLFAPGNLGKGDFNIYRMFVESALLLTGPNGAAAQITPSGVYNGANAQAIRAELFDRWDLKLVLGLINKGGHWFSGIDPTQRFAVYSARPGGPTVTIGVAFHITDDALLAAAVARPYMLPVETVRAQSPDALAISETAGGLDAEIADHLYRQWPAFGDASQGPPYRDYQREIDMGTDRDLFNDTEPGLPLYEGRMIGQYDHRAKAYRSGRGREAVWEELDFGSPKKAIVPQWRVPERNIPRKIGDRHRRYRVAFCDVAAARNERTLVAALVPPGVVCGHSAPTLRFGDDYDWAFVSWLAMANSLCVDFLSRKKVSLHMTLDVLKDLPIARLPLGDERLSRLAPLVLRLTCTGPEMTGYWNAMAKYGWVEPVPDGTIPATALVHDEDRAQARAEIDAVVAKHVYAVTRAQLEFIITTFDTLRRNETRQYGEFRTQRLVLEWFERV